MSGHLIMKRQETPSGNLSLESSLTDLILKPKSEKIRRPPNAFMLFAREHRRIISKQHPDVSNKVVSSMLGQIWKDAVRDFKEKYYEKSKALGELHKTRYPDYVYSPREARIRKMNKKKKKDEVNSTNSTTQSEDMAAAMELTKLEDNSNEEERISHANHDPKSSPEYVPNNPEYFAQQSPEINPEEDSDLDLRPRRAYSTESQYEQESGDIPARMDQDWTEKNCRCPTTAERCGCCYQNRLGSKGNCAPSYEKRENEGVIPHFPNHLPCSCAATSPFCNPPVHFTGPISSYCCGPRPCTSPVPRHYGPPLNPYWNPPMMNSAYYPNREYFYEDLKPYTYPTSYHTPDFYGPPFGYFDRPVTQPKRNLNPGYHPHLNDGLDFSRRGQSELATDNSVPYSCLGRSGEKKEHNQCLFERSLRAEDEMALRNRRILSSDINSNEHVIHQNPVSRSVIKPQEASSSPMYTPIGGDGRYLSSQHYQNSCDNHSSRDETTEIPSSTERVSTKPYQCDSSSSIRNQNVSHLADFFSNETETQSENVSSSALSPESNKRKFNALYAEDDDYASTINPKFYRLPTLHASESTRQHFWSSTTEKPSLANNDIQDIYNRPVTKVVDRPVYSSLENNLSVSYSNKHLSDINKTSPDFVTVVQKENRAENITEDKQAVPINSSFFKAPIQMTNEYPGNIDSADLQDHEIQRINQEISVNVQQPQFSRSVVKREVNEQDIFPINEKNESNHETGKSGNNMQNNFFRTARKIENETSSSAAPNQDKMNSIHRNRANLGNNPFVCSDTVLENANAGPQVLANIICPADQTNKSGNSDQDLSKAYSKSDRTQEKIPGFCALISNTPYKTLSSSNLSANPNAISGNLASLQPFIKVEDSQNTPF